MLYNCISTSVHVLNYCQMLTSERIVAAVISPQYCLLCTTVSLKTKPTIHVCQVIPKRAPPKLLPPSCVHVYANSCIVWSIKTLTCPVILPCKTGPTHYLRRLNNENASSNYYTTVRLLINTQTTDLRYTKLHHKREPPQEAVGGAN